MHEINSGWFVKFTPDEKKLENDIIDRLKEFGYPEGGEGIKEFMKDLIYDESVDEDEEKDEKTNTFFEALKDNPDAVSQVVGGTIDLVTKAINKKIFKK